jgi:hypothetical protein
MWKKERPGSQDRGVVMEKSEEQQHNYLQNISIGIPHVTVILSSVINVAFFKSQLCLPERGVVAPVACGGL